MQAMIAAAFAKSDHYKVAVSTARVLQVSYIHTCFFAGLIFTSGLSFLIKVFIICSLA
jgi:hypothetical protein